MTIQTMYGVQCDTCGFSNLFTHWRAEYAQEFVESAGWHTNGEQHTCPFCIAKKLRYTPESN